MSGLSSSIKSAMSSSDADAADLSVRLERINTLTEQLFRAQASSIEARALADRIHREIRAARELLDQPKARS